MSILAAKDENVVASAIASTLTDLGYHLVAAVATGEDALRRTRELEPDLVLIDGRLLERTHTQLEAATAELKAFSYSIAHDLRAPLRGIDGFTQVLIEDHAATLDAEALHQLQHVRDATQRMGQLIDGLLRLSRVTTSDYRRGEVNLSTLARIAALELQVAHQERTVEVVIQDDVVIGGDEHLLQIVFENLMGNAWKFTSKTSQARIEFGSFERDGRRICFVRDNGAGFDAQYVGKMFGAFQRLHSADEFEGIGIGLAIVKRVIDRHAGRVWAEGAVGQGATFFFAV